jgi:hypothetical protein
MSGVFPVLPLYAFMEWTGTTLPFNFTFVQTVQMLRDLCHHTKECKKKKKKKEKNTHQ